MGDTKKVVADDGQDAVDAGKVYAGFDIYYLWKKEIYMLISYLKSW